MVVCTAAYFVAVLENLIEPLNIVCLTAMSFLHEVFCFSYFKMSLF